jgi:nickel-dependent lactate racemase
MIMPGIAHVDSIAANHRNLCQITESGGMVFDNWGRVDDNSQRLDMEEISQMARLDFSVNAIVNMRRETVGLFAGDLVEAHRAGVKIARNIYATKAVEPADIVVVNAYVKANEAALVVTLGSKMLKESGGDLVVTANIPEGQICHYLLRSFGKDMGGQLWRKQTELPTRVKRMYALGPYLDKAGLDWVGPIDRISILDSWSEILAELQKNYKDKAKVVVIPDGTLQYFPRSKLPQRTTISGD